MGEDSLIMYHKTDKLAQIAFAAYSLAAGGETWDGKPIPPWSEATEQVRNNWRAAAKAIYIETLCNPDVYG